MNEEHAAKTMGTAASSVARESLGIRDVGEDAVDRHGKAAPLLAKTSMAR